MAMSAAITWEFNASATANMVNGGGWKTGASGTDYSTATGAHLTITDLASDGAGGVSSVLTPFDAQDVGNVLHITATGTGFTVGWYEVVSIAGAVVTLDRSPGLSKTGGTAYLGGALSLNSTLDDEFFDQLVAGQKVYFLKGNYTLGEAVSAAGNGTTTLPICMTGYAGTRDTTCNGLDRPNIVCGTNTFVTGFYWWISKLNLTGTASPIFTLNFYSVLYNCKFLNSSTTDNYVALNVTEGSKVFDCECISYGGRGISLSNYCVCIGNYAHHSSTGIYASSGNNSIIGNIISSNLTNGILMNSIFQYIINNTIYGSENKNGIGINMGTKYDHFILNNIIYGFVTGISATAADKQTYVDYNDLYNNTTPVTNVTELSNDVATDPKFVNAAGTLISDCETQWSYADGDVTLTADPTVYKVGAKSMKAVCGVNLGAGDIVCANAITSTNMSTYDGIGVWVRSDTALAANDWQFLLSDQANCANIILAYNLPAMTANTWYWIYVGNQDMSTATAIISIGFKQVVDKGAMTFYADDVRGCDNDFSLDTGSGAIDTGFSYCKPV